MDDRQENLDFELIARAGSCLPVGIFRPAPKRGITLKLGVSTQAENALG